MSQASYASFLSLAGQVLPVLLLAILVDAARGTSRLRWNPSEHDLTKVAARQSRRVIAAIIIGGAAEMICLGNLILAIPDPKQWVPPYPVVFTVVVILLSSVFLLYALLMPHLEYHASVIFSQRDTYKAWFAWAWVAVGLIAVIGVSLWIVDYYDDYDDWQANKYIAYGAFALVFFASGVLIAIWVAKRTAQSDTTHEDKSAAIPKQSAATAPSEPDSSETNQPG